MSWRLLFEKPFYTDPIRIALPGLTRPCTPCDQMSLAYPWRGAVNN